MWDRKRKATKEQDKHTLTDTDNSTVVATGKGGRGRLKTVKGVRHMEGDEPVGGEHTVLRADEVAQNGTLETYIINQCHPNKFYKIKKLPSIAMQCILNLRVISTEEETLF